MLSPLRELRGQGRQSSCNSWTLPAPRQGKLIDVLEGVEVTCIDVANPCVLVNVTSSGVDGATLPAQIDFHPTLLSQLESIRQHAAMAMGLSKPGEIAPTSIPNIGIVSTSSGHALLSGEILEKQSIVLVVRIFSMGQPHRATPITMALAVAAAAKLSGSVVAESVVDDTANAGQITIGHPIGKLMVEATFYDHGGLNSAIFYRTARRFVEGTVFWK